MSPRIVDVREVTKPIASPIRNAYIDFSKMTSSLVAVITNVTREGRPVVGYGFNSNGRYGQGGLIRERFAPRLLEADPKLLLDATSENIDPDRAWATMMANEKPGGHGERSVAVGTLDMAIWDAVAKIAGKPLFRLLAERHGRKADPRVFVYAAGGYYYPGKDLDALRREMRGYLDRGYNVVKMKIGGAPLAEDRQRIEAVLTEIDGRGQLAVDANGRFDLETAIAYAKALRDYPLFWYEEAGDPLDFQLQASLADFYPGPMATEKTSSATRTREIYCAMAACGPTATGCNLTAPCPTAFANISARSKCWQRTAGRQAVVFRTAAIRCRSISRLVSGSEATKAIRICSSHMADFRTAFAWTMATSLCLICPVSVSKGSPS